MGAGTAGAVGATVDGCGVGAGAADGGSGVSAGGGVVLDPGVGVDVVAGCGAVSTRVASVRSDDALRNSRMLLPSAAPTSGKRPGPMITRAITRMMISSNGPMLGMGW